MNTWGLVLAAGEGSRLRALTTTHTGLAVPKQFCSLRGGPSLLQEALQRAEAIAPLSRTCTIVAAQHQRFWEQPLARLPAANVIVQPQNRGTANGLLLPLLHIAARDSQASVVVLPADHYVRDEATLARSLRQAITQVARSPENLHLLGIGPEEADPELGYIVPGKRDAHGALEVAQFIEKPPLTLARALIDRGGLWNAFILAGTVQAFLAMFERRHPQLVMQMRAAVHRDRCERDDATMSELYQRLPQLDFSRDVLQGNELGLRVQPVPACGWSDLGTPKRVTDALRRMELDGRRGELVSMSSALLSLAAQHARLHAAL